MTSFKKHPFDFKTQYGLGFNYQDDEIVVGESINGAGAWDSTPWVWVVKFKRISP